MPTCGRVPRVLARLEVPRIVAWNHETLVRYRATVVLRDGAGDVLDVRTRFVGFRRIEIADRKLLVNGEPVLIRGVNRHDHDPDRGKTVSRRSIRRDLELLKRHHLNAVRTAALPQRPVPATTCVTSSGCYVVDEANIETHARLAQLRLGPALRPVRSSSGCVAWSAATVDHPSIIGWSLGNESGYAPIHDAMAAWIRRNDPSRYAPLRGCFTAHRDAAKPGRRPTSPVRCTPSSGS